MSSTRLRIRETCLEVSLDAVRHNASAFAAAARRPLWAVVKADAYGHGAVAVARALAEHGDVCGFAVSLVEEGIDLRAAGITKPILVMGPALAGGYRAMAHHRLTPMIARLADLAPMAAAAPGATVHLKIDTGMSRLGIAAEDAAAAVDTARGLGLEVGAVATHFACADDDDPADPESMTARQLRAFRAVTDGLGGLVRHAANSAACAKFPAASFDQVRIGLGLYGAGVARQHIDLRQAARLSTEVAQVREVTVGSTVSYGALWTASRPSRIAVLPVGYADGVPRAMTGRMQVLLRGRRLPAVGAVSMDMTLVDVTDVDGLQPGESVVLLGDQGSDSIPTSEFAGAAVCTEYEVTCGISKRVPRTWK